MRRNEILIKYDILISCKEPVVMTSLMYDTHLSYRNVKRHVEDLIRTNLIERLPPVSSVVKNRKNKRVKGFYITTSEGQKLILEMDRIFKTLLGNKYKPRKNVNE